MRGVENCGPALPFKTQEDPARPQKREDPLNNFGFFLSLAPSVGRK